MAAASSVPYITGMRSATTTGKLAPSPQNYPIVKEFLRRYNAC